MFILRDLDLCSFGTFWDCYTIKEIEIIPENTSMAHF